MKKNFSLCLVAAGLLSMQAPAAWAEMWAGTPNNDLMIGSTKKSNLYAKAGNDTLYGDPVMHVAQPTSVTRLTEIRKGGAVIPADRSSSLYNYSQVFSKSGEKMVFRSSATNLVPGVPPGIFQIYVKDMKTGAITLASSLKSRMGILPGDSHSFNPTISNNGKYVAFTTKAPNLSGSSPNYYQIAVKNLETGLLTILSRQKMTGELGRSKIYGVTVAFSPNDKMVAFGPYESNLIYGTGNGNSEGQVYLAKYTGWADDYKSLVIASAQEGGTAANRYSGNPVFMPDNKGILFHSYASNLIKPVDHNIGYPDFGSDLFLKEIPEDFSSTDVLKEKIHLISTNDNGKQGKVCNSGEPAVSPAGDKIAFISNCDGFGSVSNFQKKYYLFIKTLDPVTKKWSTSKITHVIGKESHAGVFSPDGTKFAANKTGGFHIIDLVKGDTVLIKDGRSPYFSPDGRSIVFHAPYNRIFPGDPRYEDDIFLATFPASPGGNDLMDGGEGADRMIGGKGDDTYYVDSLFDQVIEEEGGGTDTVIVSFNGYVKPPHIEKVLVQKKR